MTQAIAHPEVSQRGMTAFYYWLLLSLESIGIAVILAHGVPIYRRLLTQGPQPQSKALSYAFVAVCVIQVSYWTRLCCIPRPVLRRRVLAHHLIRFVSRFTFVFATGLFSTVFIIRWEVIEFSAWKVLMLFGVLFSFFCHTVELEGLSDALAAK